MKKIACILSALILAGCTAAELGKDKDIEHIGKVVYTARFENTDSKVYVDEALKTRWTEGDKISVFSTTYNQPYRFNGKTGDKEGTFTDLTTGFFTGGEVPTNYAVYPYSEGTSITEEGMITVTLPTVQTYSPDSYGLGANTMVATTEDKSSKALCFKSLCGYVVVQIYGEATIKSITLSGNNGEKISGQATVTPVYGQEPNVIMSESAKKSIVLDCGEGVTIGKTAEEATSFWFAVPPVSFTKGFTIKVTNTNGFSIEKSTDKERIVKRNVKNSLSVFKAPRFPDSPFNIDGYITCDGIGVPDVLVSDGIIFAKTDADGFYHLGTSKKQPYVFVIIPSGYEVSSEGVRPLFYALLDGSSTIETKNFELTKVDNDDFTLFVLGDMHLANRTNDIQQFAGVANSLNSAIAQSGKSYCLTLGDMTWDLYWYDNKYCFPEYLQTVNDLFKNVLFFHTMGNHDNDMESVGDYLKAFRYMQEIAPTYYSFNLGKVHFVVLDNIDYNAVGTGKENRSKYVLDYTAEQMAWLRKDLSYVSKTTPVYIASHAPVSRPNGASSFNNSYMSGANDTGEANMADFIEAVKDYDVHFLSGHTHNLFHRKHSDKFSEHNEGAVCATWWWTGYLTPGIHVSVDGTPGGYGVWDFKGTDVTYSYQAAGHDANYQFRAYDMNKVKEVYAANNSGLKTNAYTNAIMAGADAFPANTILVNVWDWDEKWDVKILEGSQELTVTPVYTYDPVHAMSYTFPRSKVSSAISFPTEKWPHFFQAKASSASSTVTVKVTDRNGKVYTETMTRPKAFILSDYYNN